MERVQRYSRKRQAIYDALMQSHEHPSAETLYHILKPVYPDLSLGTVYRNLKSLMASGDVVCVANVDGKDRFDVCIRPHGHLVCRQCGAICDLQLSSELLEQCEILGAQCGMDIDPCSLHVSGLCQHCKDRESPDPIYGNQYHYVGGNHL